MGSVLNESDRAAIDKRMRALSATSSRRWGSLDVNGMLRHLRLLALMDVGELSVPSVNKSVCQVFPLKHLLLYVVPFPKGAPTAPKLKPDASPAELNSDGSMSFEEERAAVLELLQRIGTGATDGMGPEHPLFGPLSRREWAVVTYKHADHHLKQFGA